MTPEQGDRFLAAFLEDDDYHLACAEREPDEDSALGVNYHRPVTGERPMATTAMRSGNEWIINGIKDGTANAPIAKLIAVEAQTDRGPALILVPAGTPGLSVAAQPGPCRRRGIARHGARCAGPAVLRCRWVQASFRS